MDSSFCFLHVLRHLLFQIHSNVFHVLEQFENELDTSQVDSHFLSQTLDPSNPLNVVFTIKPVFGSRPRGCDQTQPLVLPEGLWVNSAKLGSDSNHVHRVMLAPHAGTF